MSNSARTSERCGVRLPRGSSSFPQKRRSSYHTAQRPGFFSVEKAQEIPPFPRISLRKSGPRHLPRLFLSLSQNNCCSTESKATSSRQTTYILCAGGPSSFVSLDLRPPSSLRPPGHTNSPVDGLLTPPVSLLRLVKRIIL